MQVFLEIEYDSILHRKQWGNKSPFWVLLSSCEWLRLINESNFVEMAFRGNWICVIYTHIFQLDVETLGRIAQSNCWKLRGLFNFQQPWPLIHSQTGGSEMNIWITFCWVWIGQVAAQFLQSVWTTVHYYCARMDIHERILSVWVSTNLSTFNLEFIGSNPKENWWV